MKIYLAGPLFTAAERKFNTRIAWSLRDWGFEIWLPQDKEPRDLTAKNIFLTDVEGIEWADVVLACMDGPDPDSGTCWEVGYAYAKGKPVVCYRTDFRNAEDFAGSRYNLMLSQSATENIHVPASDPAWEKVLLAKIRNVLWRVDETRRSTAGK